VTSIFPTAVLALDLQVVVIRCKKDWDELLCYRQRNGNHFSTIDKIYSWSL